jgi:hypothetical protein
MISIRALFLSSLLLAAFSVKAVDFDDCDCRCEAPDENLYLHPRLQAGQETNERVKNRELEQFILSPDGYIIMDGIKVIPLYDPACLSERENNMFDNRHLMESYGADVDEEEKEEEIKTTSKMRTLKGMMSSKGSKGKGYSYDDGGLYYFGGKGKVSPVPATENHVMLSTNHISFRPSQTPLGFIDFAGRRKRKKQQQRQQRQ